MPNPKTIVTTNRTPGSIKEVALRAVTFRELWDSYPFGDPYDDPGYENQCAIRMSVTFHRLGIRMKSFSSKLVHPMSGQATIGRIMLDGMPTATRADELGAWLRLQPFAGLPKAEVITGPDWESTIKGRTGIVQYSRYWTRPGEDVGDASGGHIDLWNGSRLTFGSFGNTFSTLGRMFGRRSFRPAEPFGWSDLGLSKQILFWEIQ